MPPIRKVNLEEAFATFTEAWSPRVAADVDEFQVKLVKLDGEFVWHSHEHEDELFLVHRGALTIQMRDHEVRLEPGEMVVIPRGVEHRPVAESGCEVILLERASVVNTGDVDDPRRVTEVKRVGSS